MHILAFTSRALYLLRGTYYRALIRAAGGQCGSGLRVEAGLKLRHGAHAGLNFGHGVYLGAGTVIDCPVGGSVILGDNVTLTHGIFISAARLVSVGTDTLIGEYVSIRDADHEIDVDAGPIRHQPMKARGCRIGSDVWVGRGCAVLSGAELQDGCVIGANSVVKGLIPSLTIAAGAPAVVRRMRPNAGPVRTA